MAYNKQSFTDFETVLTAEHLNHIEKGIEDAHIMLEELPTTDELVTEVINSLQTWTGGSY